MGLRNTTAEYGTLAKSLHWLVATGIIALIVLGIEQSDMPRGDEKSYIRYIHASIATIVLALMTVRIVWRFMNQTPAHPDGMATWQKLSSSIVHWGLYAAVFVQLIAGAFVAGTGGKGLPVFSFLTIPLPIAEDRESHEWWEGVHEFVWKPLLALLLIHVLGALYNHFVVKNDVVRRMTIGIK